MPSDSSRRKEAALLARRVIVRGLIALSLANLFFLLLHVLTQTDPGLVSSRVRAAFESGDLVQADYLPFDARRGWHQYTDCSALQMLSNENPSRLAQALSPVLYAADEEWNGQCALLHELVVDGTDRETLLVSRYSRYWHGYNAVAASALRVMDLGDLRRLLAGAMWLAIGGLFVAAYRAGGHVRLVGCSIALVAASFWSVPYFAPNLVHGPGDTLVLLGVAGLAAWPRIAGRLDAIVPYSAAFGACVVFFEANTGQLAVGAAWLLAMTLAAGQRGSESRPRDPRVAASVALLAFGFAAVATGIAKQVVARLVTDPGAGGQFLSHLSLYMSLPASEEGWPGYLVPYGRLVRKSGTLTYGSLLAGYALLAVAILTWAAAGARALLKHHRVQRLDFVLLVLAALMPVAWVALMPTAAYVHAVFWVRAFVAPIALAPVALFWPSIRVAGAMRPAPAS